MVTVIHHSKSLKNVLNYNEQKAAQGKATCLKAVNYPKSVGLLNFSQKLNRLTNQAALNERTKVNAVHISLNFDFGENVPQPIMEKIAVDYMEKIGFGEQPYLVYRHHDAGHDHLHIVTTNIQTDGKRISLHNLGRIQSEKARKEIEIHYGLIKAESKKAEQKIQPKVIDTKKLQYGKSDTRRSIANVIETVVYKYRFTSLPELNAVLQLYSVVADRGAEDSRIYQRGGLVYRILDDQQNKIGVPIKASILPKNPGLKFMEEKFVENEQLRLPFKRRLKTKIDWVLTSQNQNLSMNKVTEELAKESIDLIKRINKEGVLYGITYIDHKNKVVFNGSDLGKAYSAKGLQERCLIQIINENPKTQLATENKPSANHSPTSTQEQKLPKEKTNTKHHTILLDLLINPKINTDFVPGSSSKKRRRKKKKS